MFDCCGCLDWIDVCTDVCDTAGNLMADAVVATLPFITTIASYLGFTL